MNRFLKKRFHAKKSFTPFLDVFSVAVGEWATDDQDEINENSDTEAACGKKPKETGTDFSCIEAMCADGS